MVVMWRPDGDVLGVRWDPTFACVYHTQVILVYRRFDSAEKCMGFWPRSTIWDGIYVWAVLNFKTRGNSCPLAFLSTVPHYQTSRIISPCFRGQYFLCFDLI